MPSAEPTHDETATKSSAVTLILSWSAVLLPLAWGVIETLRKTAALFH
jgi:hypothetical protein